jgi:hypothetical protein
MNDRRHYPLTAVSADGWFDKLGESSPSFRQLCDAIGKQFLAYSVIAGVRITAVSIDQRSQDASLVDFMLDDQQEHRLALGEFRRRVAATMLAEEPVPDSLPATPTPEDLQGFLGGRFVLLAPLFGLGLRELRVGGGKPPALLIDLGGARDEVPLSELHDLVRDRVRASAQAARPQSPFAIDLNVIPKAERANADGDWEKTVELLGPWPSPLSLLLRTAEGQSLAPEVRATLARSLALLGTAYAETNRHDWAEDVMRLGIQWGQDGPAAGDLFRRLGQSYVERGRSGQAIGFLRRAIALGARERDTLPLLARCFVERGWMLAAAVVCDQASAVGTPDAELAGARKAAEGALGDAWKKFRAQVPPPRRIESPVYRAES